MLQISENKIAKSWLATEQFPKTSQNSNNITLMTQKARQEELKAATNLVAKSQITN